VQPLHLFENNEFVEPQHANRILANSLAEIHFSLRHYRIQRRDQKPFDSFTADIEQIIVLKSGTPKSRSAYKRSNPRTGPLHVKRSKLSTNPDSTLMNVGLRTSMTLGLAITCSITNLCLFIAYRFTYLWHDGSTDPPKNSRTIHRPWRRHRNIR
jgi:hypothetical protein